MTAARKACLSILIGIALVAAWMCVSFTMEIGRLPHGAEAYNWYFGLIEGPGEVAS